MTSIRIERIGKRFGDTIALDDITLDIAAGELFFLLGPSGCGKSTLLRIIAGLQSPSSGRILFNQDDVTDLPTEKRNAVMCFQSYALWPHLSVRDNIGFGLETRNWPRQKRQQRIDEVLALVQLDALGRRKPNELSGGQQQRVALARALAVNPACLLLDEPLSNLDAQLRQEMRTEIRRICKSGQFTTIYVTHDQREALSIADRIALLKDGRLVQVGKPEDLYLRPANSFAAAFVGQTNLIAGQIIGRNDAETKVQTALGVLSAAGNGDLPGKVIVSIRPERLRPSRQGEALRPGLSRFDAQLTETTFLGDSSEHVLEVAGESLRMISTPPMFQPPRQISVEVDAGDVVLLRE